MSEMLCESQIKHVAVFARGAVVTRRVTLPSQMPEDEVDLVVTGVTPLATRGTARATLKGTREVILLRTRLVIPAAPSPPGKVVERVRDLLLARDQIELERHYLQARRQLFADLVPSPRLDTAWRKIDPEGRVKDALAVTALADTLAGEIDAKLMDLDEAARKNAREIERSELEASQARTAERVGAGQPTYEVVVRIGAGGASTLSELEISYGVPGARWWPAYSVRLTEQNQKAAWALEAHVAQATGEDWAGVALTLSTVDLIRDARLPELASFRLGRAQAPPRRGYRPLPEGLDSMFGGYDRAISKAPAPPRSVMPAPPAPPPPPPLAGIGGSHPESALEEDEDTFGPVAARGAPQARALPAPPRAMMSAKFEAAPAMAPAPQAAPMPQRSRTPMFGGAAAVPPELRAPGSPSAGGMVRGEPTPVAKGGAAHAQEQLEPVDTWLDFDRLILGQMNDRAHRGRLAQDPGVLGDAGPAAAAREKIERVIPPGAMDPKDYAARGFQLSYDSNAPADVPSNALAHRVLLSAAEARSQARLIVVPRESGDVYREAKMTNPFDVALLPGAVDVFVDGALLTTSRIGIIGLGGIIELGLGVEDRMRVARNARVEESTAGLLGGQTVSDHTITIDLSSALGAETEVEVFDRIPVTDDKDVTIELRAARPKPEKYAQSEKGEPIRGGQRWRARVPAGGKTQVEFAYRITLSSKSELTGGNRRD